MVEYLLPLIFSIAGFFKGLDEGMDNIRFNEPMHSKQFIEGVRGHKWHKKYYHWIVMGHDGFVYVSGILTVIFFNYQMLFLGFILAWELCEIGHAIARVRKPIMQSNGQSYERLILTDIIGTPIHGNAVYLIHGFRWILAIGILLINLITL